MNNKLISKLFLERSRFVLIGLTGRTGSGCTTAANILETKSPAFPLYEDAIYEGSNFYNGLSKQRYNIVKKYAEDNWEQFYSIKVSDLISAYLLTLSSEDMSKFILGSYTGLTITKEQIDKLLNTGVFKKNYIRKFTVFQNYILNHIDSEKPTKDELKKFDSYLKLVRKFTINFKSELNKLRNDLYISTYQTAGLSIRKLGRVDICFDSSTFSPDSVFHLPETINRIIIVDPEIRTID